MVPWLKPACDLGVSEILTNSKGEYGGASPRSYTPFSTKYPRISALYNALAGYDLAVL